MFHEDDRDYVTDTINKFKNDTVFGNCNEYLSSGKVVKIQKIVSKFNKY